MAYPLGTIRTSYRPFRALVSNGSEDTDLTASQKKWSYFVSTLHPVSGSSGIAIKLDPRYNQATVIFDHTADAATGTFIVYAVREANKKHLVAPAERVCTSTLVAGKQETNDSTPRYFVDTIAAPTDSWPASVSSDATMGLDNVAHLTFDIRGYKYLLCLITVVSAGGIRAWIAYH